MTCVCHASVRACIVQEPPHCVLEVIANSNTIRCERETPNLDSWTFDTYIWFTCTVQKGVAMCLPQWKCIFISSGKHVGQVVDSSCTTNFIPLIWGILHSTFIIDDLRRNTLAKCSRTSANMSKLVNEPRKGVSSTLSAWSQCCSSTKTISLPLTTKTYGEESP